jgi:MoaE-MoaD fusion protein
MRVHVKFFAIFREFTKIRSESKEISEGTTVERLWKEYAATHARIANLRAAYAVNQQLVKPDQVLHEDDEIAFLPPVSGGALNTKKLGAPAKTSKRAKMRNSRERKKNGAKSPVKGAFITNKPIDLNALYKRVAFPGAGAIITFSGVVRDNAHGKSVEYLEYEAYPEMAEATMLEIITEIVSRWQEARVAMAHRVGRLEIGEASLGIAVSAPHRPEAYAASRYAIERVKAILPVWKKEFATDGEHWVEGPLAGELASEKAMAIVTRAEVDAKAP